MSTCANCGKGEEASIDLKACAACKLVKYCSRDCQIAHRPQHKKECKRRVVELHDEKLFKTPPPEEDCPICMIRLPCLDSGQTYMPCCGKVVCSGCIFAVQFRAASQKKDDVCPFCRTLPPSFDEEMAKRYEQRSELNDAQAIYNLGCAYSCGDLGLPQDISKALELWQRAGELGSAEAHYNMGNTYKNGSRGVEVDKKKAKYYYELSAIDGCVEARHNLGCLEGNLGNVQRALKHWMISARGSKISLSNIKLLYSRGQAAKDDYTKALQSYQAYLDEIRSAQRDEAFAYGGDHYKYYY